MDDYSLLVFLLSPHLFIAPLGVDCKFAVTYKKNLSKKMFHRKYLTEHGTYQRSLMVQ